MTMNREILQNQMGEFGETLSGSDTGDTSSSELVVDITTELQQIIKSFTPKPA